MTALAWLACAAAIVLVPGPSPLPGRLRRLSAAGRLAGAPGRIRSRLVLPAVDGPAAVAVAAAVAGALAAVRGVALAVAAVAVVAVGGHVLRVSLSRRRASRERDELIVALRLLAAELVAGSRPVAALHAAAEATPCHAAALRALAVSPEVSLEVSLEASPGSSGAGPPAPMPAPIARLAQAWRVCELSGAPLADVVGRLVADLDDARERDRQVSGALAGPRSSAALLAGLPVLGLALGAAMGADPVHVLVDSSAGRVVCAVGAVLDALGVVWTMRIAAGAERE